MNSIHFRYSSKGFGGCGKIDRFCMSESLIGIELKEKRNRFTSIDVE